MSAPSEVSAPFFESEYFLRPKSPSHAIARDQLALILGNGLVGESILHPNCLDPESNKLAVFDPPVNDSWPSSLTKAAIDLHDGLNRMNYDGEPLPDTGQPPTIIFVAATRAVPAAFALKEFWRTAYPKETTPPFAIFDVSSKRGRGAPMGEKLAWVIQRLKKTANRFGVIENAAVFDEYMHSGRTLMRAGEHLQAAGFRGVNFMRGRWIRDSVKLSEAPLTREVYLNGVSPDGLCLMVNGNDATKRLVNDMKTVGRLMVESAKEKGVL